MQRMAVATKKHCCGSIIDELLPRSSRTCSPLYQRCYGAAPVSTVPCELANLGTS